MSKHLALLFVAVFTLSSLAIVESAFAQSLPKPSVPELISLTYIENSYYVPPTYGINPYTGENITITEGYHVNVQSIVAKVSNQPFTLYSYAENNYTFAINLYFNFRYKGHFGNDWKYFPINPQTGLSTNRYSAMFYKFADFPNFTASSIEYTVLPIDLTFLFSEPPTNGQIDFQVEAQIGRIDSMGDGFYYFVGESSEWSNTQTIKIPTSDSSSSSLPSNPITDQQATDSNSQGAFLTRQSVAVSGAIVGIIVLVAAVLLVYFKKRKHLCS